MVPLQSRAVLNRTNIRGSSLALLFRIVMDVIMSRTKQTLIDTFMQLKEEAK
jgi:hypothetical protein